MNTNSKTIVRADKLNSVEYQIRGPLLDEANRLRAKGEEIIALNIGNPAPFEFQAPAHLIDSLADRLRNAQGYSDSSGIPRARHAIVEYYKKKNVEISESYVYTGNGASELIVMAMQALLNVGDEVLLPSPDYPLWTAATAFSGGKPVHYLLDESANWYPDIDDMRRKISPRTRAILIINPNNPTGAVYPKEVLEQVVQVARENNLILIVDEIYDRLLMDDTEHVSVASLAPDLLTIIIDKFIYQQTSQPTKYYGVAEGKNVLTVLCESLEWYTFLRGDGEYAMAMKEEYPNALDIPQEVLSELYPNLTEYYNQSVVMTNFHSREKTDIAETISIMGSYPTGAYVNYEFAGNTIPYTLPNTLKTLTGGDIYLRSFHNGFKTFYNRDEAHPMLGFEGLTDMYDMEEMSNKIEAAGGKETFYNYMDEGTRNLDSEMVETAKDLMFPTDGRFYSYITTITMHGMYYDRENLRGDYNANLAKGRALLDQYIPLEEEENNFVNAESLYYYMTTGLELDYMLGCIKRELAERKDEKTGKPLSDNTVIVLFGDHNAYYQEMSNYVKGIDGYETDKKFTDLYNVPLMIWDKDLIASMSEEERIVDKFTCTADIVPTLLDLLGINYYTNMYYGHSIFSDEVSVLYSRAYDNFIGDGILRRSVKDNMYLYDGLTETGVPVADTIAAFEKEGTELVQRIKFCDYIFKQDHFGVKANYDKFQQKLKEINA